MTLLPILPITGKSGRGKAKNKSSGSASDETTEPSESKKSKNSRTNQLFDVGSDDDDIGQETTTVINCNSKFSDIGNEKILSVLKSRELLPTETLSLCKDFEKLVLYSATNRRGENTVQLGSCLTIFAQLTKSAMTFQLMLR